MENFSQKGFSVILVLFLVIAVVGGLGGWYLYRNQQLSQKTANNTSPTLTQTTLPKQSVDSEELFFARYREKYPMPNALPVPEGLTNELFKKFNDLQVSDRKNFKITEYYGDVVYGSTGYSSWMMNKINGQWVLISNGQEAPRCEDLQRYMQDLKDWQAVCFDVSGKLVDGKHPNESYNNY